jgi:hypothetical protein
MTPEVETHHEVHRTGHKWVDWSVTGAALLVSFSSLGIAIHHGHTMKQLVEANSQPFLQFQYSDAERRSDGGFDSALLLEVENVGAGPARIEWFRANMAGKAVTNWRRALEAMQEQVIKSGRLTTRVEIGRMITADIAPHYLKAGNKLQILRWPRTETNAAFWDIARDISYKESQLRACYCSIFDQCWTASNGSFRPRSIEQCSEED